MKIKHGFEFEKSQESVRTSLAALQNMPESTRLAFFNSPEGKEIVKGVELEAENLKGSDNRGMSWSKEDIASALLKLQAATPDEYELMLQLLPGPVLSIITQQMNKHPMPAKENQPSGYWGEGAEVLEKANKSNPEGYQKWLKAIREKRAMKSAHQPGDRVKYHDYSGNSAGKVKVGYIHATHPFRGEVKDKKGKITEEQSHHVGYEPNPNYGKSDEEWSKDRARKPQGGHAHLISDQPGSFNGGGWHHSSAIIEKLGRKKLNYDKFQHTRDKVKDEGYQGHPTKLPSKDEIGRYHDEIMQKLGVDPNKRDKSKDSHSNYSWMHGKDSVFKVGKHEVRLHTQAHTGHGDATSQHVEHHAQWIHPKDTNENKYKDNKSHEHDPEKLVSTIKEGISKDQPRVEKEVAKKKQKESEHTTKLAEFKKLHPDAAKMFAQHYSKASKKD